MGGSSRSKAGSSVRVVAALYKRKQTTLIRFVPHLEIFWFRAGMVPGFPTVIRALDDLAEPAAGR